MCFLRRTSTSVAIPGTDIELPQLDDDPASQQDNEDRIYVPAQTDCWGGCKYCYYCIADGLARHAQVSEGAKDEKLVTKWTCLRCGGAATKATRVGAEPREVSSSSEAESTSESEAENSPKETDDEWEKVDA